MYVKILAGTYGYHDENGRLRPKNGGDVVDLADDEAKRLISLRIAEATEMPFTEPLDADGTDDAPDASEALEEAGMSVSDMSFDQLKDAAEQMGINTSKLRSKKALMEAIEAASVELPEA